MSDRSSMINSGKTGIVDFKLQSPIFNTSKCLPHNMRIRISLTKNTDGFLLLSEDEKYSIFIEDCYLHVTFITPHDSFLKQIDERLSIEPAPYFIPKTGLSYESMIFSIISSLHMLSSAFRKAKILKVAIERIHIYFCHFKSFNSS